MSRRKRFDLMFLAAFVLAIIVLFGVVAVNMR